MRLPYVTSWSGGLQWSFWNNWVLEGQYQGQAGVGLLNHWNVNVLPLDILRDLNPLNTIFTGVQNYLPYPHFGEVRLFSNLGHNSYRGGTVRVAVDDDADAAIGAAFQRVVRRESEPVSAGRVEAEHSDDASGGAGAELDAGGQPVPDAGAESVSKLQFVCLSGGVYAGQPGAECVRGPGLASTQFSVAKRWTLKERFPFQTRLDGNKMPFKQPQYGDPNGSFSANTPGAFARIGSARQGAFSDIGMANWNLLRIGRFQFWAGRSARIPGCFPLYPEAPSPCCFFFLVVWRGRRSWRRV